MLKSFPKILIIFFITIFIFQLACLLFLSVAPSASQAADDIKFTPQVQLPGYTFDASDKSTGNIARYIRAIYKYAIGIVGILAAVVLMIGGVMWIIAGGSATMIGEAKAWIGASLTGLTLALLSYLILATVNPALVDLKITGIKTVATQGCCVPANGSSKECTAGSTINDAGKNSCLADNKYDSRPCNTILQCKQYVISCDNSNNGEWCDDKKTQGCFDGKCQECSKINTDCGPGNTVLDPFFGTIKGPVFCCPGLRCNDPFLGKCIDQFL